MKTLTLDLSWINKLTLKDFNVDDSTWSAIHGSCAEYPEFTVSRKSCLSCGTVKPTLKQIKDRLRKTAVARFVEERKYDLADQILAAVDGVPATKLTVSVNVSFSV